MDRRTLPVLIAIFLLLAFWPALVNPLSPPKPLPQDTNQAALATNGAGGTPSLPQGPAVPVARQARQGFSDTGFHPPGGAGAGETLALENEEARYVFSSRGGGIDYVQLKEHRDAVICRDRQANATVGPATW